MAIDVNAVMDGIGTRLATITGLRVDDFRAPVVSVPAAIVGAPLEVAYDVTKVRGTDRAVFPVWVLVGQVSDRAARDALGVYMAGTGASSVKAAIDGTLGGIVHAAWVRRIDMTDTVTVNGIEYLGATYEIEVWD